MKTSKAMGKGPVYNKFRFGICLCLAYFRFEFRKLKADKMFSWKNPVSQTAKRRLHTLHDKDAVGILLIFAQWFQGSSAPKFNWWLHYLKNVQSYSPL